MEMTNSVTTYVTTSRNFKCFDMQNNTDKNNNGLVQILLSGPRLNIKTVLSTYGDFHVKDKTAVRTSYL